MAKPKDDADWVSRTDIHERYSRASSKAGDIGRQLALAGLAIVWLFGGGGVSADGGLRLHSTGLVWVGLLLVLALGLDFLQYVYGALAWGAYGRYMERRQLPTVNGTPAWLNWVTLALFWGKLASTAGAYVLLTLYFIDRV